MSFDHTGSSPRTVWNVRIDAVHSPVEVESSGGRYVLASTNDLLGLANDLRVREAAVGASKRMGVGPLESLSSERALEEQLQTLFGVRHVRLTSTAALLPVLFGDGRADDDLHLHFAQPPRHVFDDLESLEAALAHAKPPRVAASAVRLMSGDFQPIPRIAETCDRAHTMFTAVDPAGFGILGAKGRGAIEHLGGDFEHVACISLAPVLGPEVWAIVNADKLPELAGPRTTAPTLAAIKKTTELALEESSRRARLFDVHERLVNALRSLGFDTGPSVTPWVRVWMGDEDTLETWCTALREASTAVSGIRWGTQSRLKLSLAATTPDATLDQVIDTFERLAKKLGIPADEQHAPLREAISLSRPGSSITTTPAGEHWRTEHTEHAHRAMSAGGPQRPLRERMSDMVETFAWRATRIRSSNIPGTETLRTLLDKARPSKKK